MYNSRVTPVTNCVLYLVYVMYRKLQCSSSVSNRSARDWTRGLRSVCSSVTDWLSDWLTNWTSDWTVTTDNCGICRGVTSNAARARQTLMHTRAFTRDGWRIFRCGLRDARNSKPRRRFCKQMKKERKEEEKQLKTTTNCVYRVYLCLGDCCVTA